MGSLNKRAHNEAKSLDKRRLEAQFERLGTWEFAERFPALAAACLENERMKQATVAEHPELTGEGLLKTIRGRWKRRGIPREHTEAFRRLHLISLIDDVLSLAAGCAHEFTTGVELRDLVQSCSREIETRRAKLDRVRYSLTAGRGSQPRKLR